MYVYARVVAGKRLERVCWTVLSRMDGSPETGAAARCRGNQPPPLKEC